jgi:hypothetical protein
MNRFAMNFTAGKKLSLIISLAGGLATGLLWSHGALAGAADALVPPGATGTNIPALPKLKSPVDTFRSLLAMSPVERRRTLANRPPEVQKRILAKLLEYDSLKPGERELRLRATELQWYLLPLMSSPATNRAAQLAIIPDEQRKLVKARLERWDLLPPPVRQEMLNHDMTARYLSQPEMNRALTLTNMSPERRATLDAGLARWRGLSEEQRQKTLDSFNAFFELTPREKEKALNTLNTLSEAEQRQMEKTLQSYEKLTDEERLQCIQSFKKFAGMTLEERQQFLRNARTWKSMSPADRETWSKLVRFAPSLPPLPPTPRAQTPLASVAAK